MWMLVPGLPSCRPPPHTSVGHHGPRSRAVGLGVLASHGSGRGQRASAWSRPLEIPLGALMPCSRCRTAQLLNTRTYDYFCTTAKPKQGAIVGRRPAGGERDRVDTTEHRAQQPTSGKYSNKDFVGKTTQLATEASPERSTRGRPRRRHHDAESGVLPRNRRWYRRFRLNNSQEINPLRLTASYIPTLFGLGVVIGRFARFFCVALVSLKA